MIAQFSTTLAWKRVVDVIPISTDWTNQLGAGETVVLASAVTLVTVWAGYDPNPADLLDGIPFEALNPNITIQNLQHGLDGVIYNIVFQITTSAGRILQRRAKLAVLQQGIPAVAPIIPYYYTSWPYPIEYNEQLKVSISPTAFSMLFNPRYSEQLQVSINPSAFTLTSSLIVYSNYIPEQLKVSITPTGFTLTLGLIVYSNYAPEQIQVAILPTSFSLTVGLVDYINYQPEQLKVSINPTGFTLS